MFVVCQKLIFLNKILRHEILIKIRAYQLIFRQLMVSTKWIVSVNEYLLEYKKENNACKNYTQGKTREDK